MGLGYDGKLYILAFDHRGSFTQRFGIEGDPRPEDKQRLADGKQLIFEGIEAALERGADPSVTGALVDEQFGGPTQIPEQAKARGIRLAMPVEKIWGDPLKGFIDGSLSRVDAAAQVADSYLRFVEVYASAEAPVG